MTQKFKIVYCSERHKKTTPCLEVAMGDPGLPSMPIVSTPPICGHLVISSSIGDTEYRERKTKDSSNF